MRRLLAVVGDATDRRAWSGIPHHLLRAARPTGFLQGGLALRPGALRGRRALWNLGTLLRTGRYGGYQYSPGFLSALMAQAGPLEDVELLSHFPLLVPPGADQPVSYYIDATLHQNFTDYGFGKHLPRTVMESALRRERENYHRATHVVCMSRWAAESVRSAYGIGPGKVHVVRAGANLDEERLRSLTLPDPPSRDVLRLGFVGKDWRRKGLLMLLEVAEELERSGQNTRVVAIGAERDQLPAHPLLEAVGFLDKERDLDRFVSTVGATHFGCLLSSAEALGISTLEFLRLGVPVVGLAVGGIPDCITPDDGILLPGRAEPRQVAQALLDAWDPAEYQRLRGGALARAPEVTWAETVRKLSVIWGPA